MVKSTGREDGLREKTVQDEMDKEQLKQSLRET